MIDINIEKIKLINDAKEIFKKNKALNLSSIINSWTNKPKISIILPVYKTNISYLKKCIDSVINQVYENWELCICDDFSDDVAISDLLNEYVSTNQKIKKITNVKNLGISESSNAALSIACGDFVLFLDHDDFLSEYALFYIAGEIIENPECNWIYYDAFLIDKKNNIINIQHNPRPDIVLQITRPYMSTHSTFRLSCLKKINFISKELDGVQDHDLGLKMIRHFGIKNIKQIPLPIYNWRKFNKSYSAINNSWHKKGEKIIEEHIKKEYFLNSVVKKNDTLPGYNIDIEIPKPEPSVSIIINTHKNKDNIENCINSILNKTKYSNYKIIIVLNNCVNEIKLYTDELVKNYNNIRLVNFNEKFNWSKQNNYASTFCNSEFLLFLNDDTEIVSSDWLCRMVSLGLLKDIGTVGAKLLYENNEIQHCGVELSDDISAFHPKKGTSNENKNYLSFIDQIFVKENHCCYANTGACLLVKKSLFNLIGMFDERLPSSRNDVDFCLRVLDHKLLNVCSVKSILIHKEGASRTVSKKESRKSYAYIKSSYGHLKYRDEKNTLYLEKCVYWKNSSTYGDITKKIAFMHIPKTAGCSLRDYYENIYGKSRIGIIYGKQMLQIYDGNINIIQNVKNNINNKKIIFSHFAYGIHNILNLNMSYVTFLRDPIERTISQYKHIIKMLKRHGNKIDKDSIEIFIKSGVLCSNLMTKQICGIKPEDASFDEINQHSKFFMTGSTGFRYCKNFWIDKNYREFKADKDDPIILNKAIDNIKKHFLFVGTKENIEQDINKLNSILNIDTNLNIPKINVSKDEKVLDNNTIDLIKKYNDLDISLYNYIVQNNHFVNKQILS
jgi:GT2 family glycosyltransferase